MVGKKDEEEDVVRYVTQNLSWWSALEELHQNSKYVLQNLYHDLMELDHPLRSSTKRI